MANKYISLIFWGVAFATLAALLFTRLMAAHGSVTYASAPFNTRLLGWTAMIAIGFGYLFQPDKEITFRWGRVRLGSLPLDDTWDWIFLAAAATATLAAIEFFSWVL